MINIYTIGVYGLSETQYFDKLITAKIDTFCDIRRRRGVRGAKYAFVNSKQLQSKLAELGIRYVYLQQLAPSKEIRDKQKEADKASRIQKRERTALSDGFISAYRNECLSQFDIQNFLEALGPSAKNVVLFCVEANPQACHRSIAADLLSKKLNDSPVIHL